MNAVHHYITSQSPRKVIPKRASHFKHRKSDGDGRHANFPIFKRAYCSLCIHTYLLISELKIVVRDAPVEILNDIFAYFMHRLGSNLLFDTRVDTRGPVKDDFKELQLPEWSIEWMLVLAP